MQYLSYALYPLEHKQSNPLQPAQPLPALLTHSFFCCRISQTTEYDAKAVRDLSSMSTP